jgi:RNA polymerase sigma-70 factor, ECF subfamily
MAAATTMPRPIPDEVLVERARNGDDGAFVAIYHRYARYVAGIVFRSLGDDADLDDIVQATFLDVSRGLAKLKEPSAFRGWLIAIAVRRIQARIRARTRLRWLKREAQERMPASVEPDQAASCDLRALYRALDTIKPNLRLPWTLHRLEGEPLAEVATICGISVSTAKRRIAKTEALLKRRFHG